MSGIRLHIPGANTPPLVTSRPTVGQILDWNENDVSRKINSPKAEKERLRIWALLRAKFGTAFVDERRPFELLNFINANIGVRSDWTRKRWNGTIQRPFNRAERLGLIVKNPYRGLTFSDGENGRDWTDAEYQALLRATTPVFRRVLVWIRFSGMRPGESRELEFSNLRLEEDKILIEKHKMRYRTKKARPVPVNKVMGKLLAWLKRNNPPAAKHILLNSFGNPWTCKTLTTRLQKLRAKLGMPDAVRLHGGRHTFATHALMNGVEQAALMELLGHKQLATLQRYVHLGDKVEHLAGAMERAIFHQPKAKKAQPKADQPCPLFDGLE